MEQVVGETRYAGNARCRHSRLSKPAPRLTTASISRDEAMSASSIERLRHKAADLKLCSGAIRRSGPAAIFVVNPLFVRSYFGPGSGSHPHFGWDPIC
jgi:hypothetical protein